MRRDWLATELCRFSCGCDCCWDAAAASANYYNTQVVVCYSPEIRHGLRYNVLVDRGEESRAECEWQTRMDLFIYTWASTGDDME